MCCSRALASKWVGCKSKGLSASLDVLQTVRPDGRCPRNPEQTAEGRFPALSEGGDPKKEKKKLEKTPRHL